MKINPNLKNTLPLPAPLLLPGLNFTPMSLPPPPEWRRGLGDGGCNQFIVRCLCCFFLLRGRTPHTLPLLQHEGSSHGKLSSINFSNISPSHKLQFFRNCPSVGPFHTVQSFRNRLLQRGSPMGSQVLPANLLQRGVFHGLQMDICSTMNLYGLQGDSLPHYGLHHGLQGKVPALVPGASPPPPFSQTLVSAELFLLHSFIPLSLLWDCCPTAGLCPS